MRALFETVARAVAFIRGTAERQMTPEAVAEEVGMSRQHLDVLFRRAMGHTLFQEIRRSQMEYVKRLLRDTDKTIDRIAYECGYGDGKSLGGIFRRLTGTAAGAYRKQFRKT